MNGVFAGDRLSSTKHPCSLSICFGPPLTLRSLSLPISLILSIFLSIYSRVFIPVSLILQNQLNRSVNSHYIVASIQFIARYIVIGSHCLRRKSFKNLYHGTSKLPKVFAHPCWQRACVEFVFWVMPLTRLVADALGVVTISLVTVSGFIGFLCILYSFYFRSHIRTQGYNRLGYFSGPWVIRIIFILFAIWWGFGEILRLEFLRQEGRVLHTLNLKWQDIVCKCYIMSNLGFAEPCLFLTLVFLLRASLQKTESGPLRKNWNLKTAMYVLLCCFPIFTLQMMVVLFGPLFKTHMHTKEWGYFFRFTSEHQDDIARCYYPLMSTILLGVFTIVLTLYMFWLGRRIFSLVISKGLQKRVLILIISVASLFPLRVVLLGLSILSKPGDALFEVIAFLAFVSILCCAGLGVCMLVYFPIADSLALKKLQDIEDRRRIIEEYDDALSLIANQGPHDELSGRNSTASGKQGSISFRTMERDDNDHSGAFVELSLFSPSQHSPPIGSPRLLGWPMLPPAAP